MSILSAAQKAALKAVNKKAWTQPFTAERDTVTATATTYYGTPTTSPVVVPMSGDWIWLDQSERRGGPGGMTDASELLLETDIINSGTLVTARTRLRVDGILCAIGTVSPYPEHGKIVLRATRVK